MRKIDLVEPGFVRISTDEDKEKFGVDIAQLCVDVGFAKTKSEARRLIKQGAVHIGPIRVRDPFARLAVEEVQEGFLWEVIEGIDDERERTKETGPQDRPA